MRSKGFTLVELLAVLVIMAVIGLIAIPTVSKIISNSKEKLAVEQLKTISRQSSNYYRDKQVLGVNATMIDLTTDELKYDGNKVEKGFVYYNEYGDSYIAIYYEEYCLIKDYNDSITYEKKDSSECGIEAPITP